MTMAYVKDPKMFHERQMVSAVYLDCLEIERTLWYNVFWIPSER